MSQLQEGQKAPGFTLQSGTGENVKLSDFAGRKNVVLYFYPKDDTPGCTTEACSFRDDAAAIDKLDTAVLGVSRDDVDSHQKFAGKFNLTFPLLADVEGKVTEAYGVWKEKNMYGKTSMGIVRSTFLIDKQGVIRKIYPKVSVEGHSREIQEFIRENMV